MSTDELEAAFTLRWQEVGLDATVHETDATIRPATPRTLGASESREVAGALLPRISLDPTGEGVGEGPATKHATDLRLVSTLGEGGMGRVHLAQQRSLDREVAVKTLKPGAPELARDTLLAEAAVTGSLEHPGIIPVSSPSAASPPTACSPS